ncbi:MAG: cytochrome c3 family protein [Deltaproteobacteria bacterium]|nr:cytochrome c3 family protein [Deltaproteobacteria bacterium]
MKRIFVWLVIWILVSSSNLYAGPYTSSAHGDSAYGVSRRGTSQYGKGHCAHCHEQHASIDGDEPEPVGGGPSAYALFYTNHISQMDNFCFQCHDNTTLISSTGIINRSYSYRAGGWTGATGDTLNNILDAFTFSESYGSSHNLNNIRTFISNKWGYNDKSNPCGACHNPHAVQGDPANFPYIAKNISTRGYPVSRPSQHSNDNNAWGLWGDGTGEKMSDYAGALTYQAPYRFYSTTPSYLEPQGNALTDNVTAAASTTDYVTFCLDCHASNTIQSATLGTVREIDWANSVHGGVNNWKRLDNQERRAPYNPTVDKNFVLACTDCHEPHGSPNYGYLIRKTVNGGVTDVKANTNTDWNTLCGKCHTHSHSMKPCIECHYHGAEHMHGRPIF